MKKLCLAAACLVLICCRFPTVIATGEVPGAHFDSTGEEIRGEIFSLINRERSGLNLNPLVYDGALSDIAQHHAEDMGRRGYFNHTSPEGMGLRERLARAGIVYRLAGETLARGAGDARSVVSLWMRSSGHKRIILGDFTKIGIGAYNRYYVLLLIRN